MDNDSDLDDELPVFDFLSQTSSRHKSGPDVAAGTFSLVNNGVGVQTGTDVMIVSSGSEDEEPYVPLAQRLKQRQENSLATKDAEPLCGLSIGHQVPRHQEAVAALSLPETNAVRSVEEIQASKEEALKRKERRERPHQEKELLRQEKERERSERKALAEAAKTLRPEECIKHMVVAVDPALLQQEGGETLLLSVRDLGCSCAIEKQPVPRSVSWMRRSPHAQSDDAACTPEPHVVMQMTVDDMVSLIHNYIQEERYGRKDCGPTLTSWVQGQQRRNPNKTLRLGVINLEKYLKSQKSQSQKKFQEAVTAEGGGKAKRRRKNGGAETTPEVSRVEIEEATVHLQLHTGVAVFFFPTWKDFSDHIAMTTKAIAEIPFKHQREKTGFSFYLESEWLGGQKVEKTGKGLLQVWKRQIQQLNRVSADMASAVLAAYPSPRLLEKAYHLCGSSNEKVLLLSDLLIRRGAGITSTTRRVGPELSNRLYLTMNSRDPEQTLESTT